MKTKLTAIFFAVALSAICVAQGRNGPGVTYGSNLNMAQLQSVSGTVSAVRIASGVQYPSITINQLQIKVAPVWYLLDNDFEIRTGDVLTVVAAPSNSSGDPYLYAVEITNTASGRRIVLRDSSGIPLWTNGQAAGTPTSSDTCLAGSGTATAAGVIEQIESGPGIQMPTLVVKSADGKLLTFQLGPERLLLQADIELKAGDRVTVQYFLASCSDRLVAMAITDAAGSTLVLRDESGFPLWN